ncbi:hypothetical protein BY996DRAFT_6438712 [Phakopsora pachyrhizi]|nr:hypothetical protein BY996DRAFT_6438712 [Phakopsora pachyrhizi]
MIGVKFRKNLDNFAWNQDLSQNTLRRRDGITGKFEHSKVDWIGDLRQKFFEFERQKNSGMRIRAIDGSENEDLRLGPCRGPNDAGDWNLMEDQELERLYSGKSNKEWLCQIKDKGIELSPIPTFKMMRWKGESADAED